MHRSTLWGLKPIFRRDIYVQLNVEKKAFFGRLATKKSPVATFLSPNGQKGAFLALFSLFAILIFGGSVVVVIRCFGAIFGRFGYKNLKNRVRLLLSFGDFGP